MDCVTTAAAVEGQATAGGGGFSNFLRTRQHRALAEGGDRYLPPRAARSHTVGSGVGQLAQAWAPLTECSGTAGHRGNL